MVAAQIGELEFVSFPSEIAVTGEEVRLEGWLKFNQKEHTQSTNIRLWVTGNKRGRHPAHRRPSVSKASGAWSKDPGGYGLEGVVVKVWMEELQTSLFVSTPVGTSPTP